VVEVRSRFEINIEYSSGPNFFLIGTESYLHSAEVLYLIGKGINNNLVSLNPS
jgi:hypothetical protein